ncbi:MAG: Sensory box histidine kinase [Candidatus Rifleibacterium amylolyticum]|nr:MAG: Sensory box histidine kinase [Candidatus Rifleibacterium amylolyticum]
MFFFQHQNQTKHYEMKASRFLLLFLLVFVLNLHAVVDAATTAAGNTTHLLSGCEQDYPPFCMVHSDGHADGFSVELMRSALARMDCEVSFATGTWEYVRGLLENGEIQALPMVGRTPEREARFDFSVPYLTMYGAIVVRQDTTDIVNINDLRGRRVAVMRGDNAEEFLRRTERGIQIITEATFVDAFKKLAAGECDAVVIQRLVALRLLQETRIDNLKVIDKPIVGFRQDFCFAVKKGDSKTLAILNEGLALLMADGTFRQLHAKWFASLEIPSSRRIIVGGDAYYPPYDYIDENGQPAGMVVEITRAAAQAVGLDVDIRLGNWSDVRSDLEQGRIDSVMGMIYSPARDRKFDFSPPHVNCEYVIAYRCNYTRKVEDLNDLTGARVTVIQSDVMHEFVLEKKIAAEINVVDNFDTAVESLAAGHTDFVLIPRMVALFLIKDKKLADIELTSRPVFSSEFCFAFAEGNKALLAKFAEGLKAIEVSGEYRKIHEKWLGILGDGESDLKVFLRYLVVATFPLLVVLLLVFGWSWTLRRQVARKTIELKQSEAQFRSLIESAPTGIMVLDEGKIVYLNDEACRIMGVTTSDPALNRLATDYLAASSQEKYKKVMATYADDSSKMPVFELEIVRDDGSKMPVDITVSTIKYHGKDCKLVFIFDITARKASEAELDRLTAAVEQVGELILITDTNAVIQYANPALESMTGYNRAEVIGKRASIFKSGQHDENFYRELWQTISSGQTWNGTMVNRCKDGSLMYEEATISPIFNESKIVSYVAVKHDITEKIRLNEQLQQAQKMESIGQLAGGVAHDYNNMLGVILGYTEMVMESIDDKSSQMYEYLTEIFKAATRSADITGQLLAFARKQTIAPIVLDLNEAISSHLKMLRRLLSEDAELAWVPCHGALLVKLDPVQIGQVLANLCVNARDAMAGNGNILIETSSAEFDEEYCETHPGFVQGRYAMLAVSDNGCGMDAETREKIFEPFFTTKGIGKGTGLGLATVFGIVKQNHGFINVYSELNKGTTIKIYIPWHESEEVMPSTKKSADQAVVSGETVLVVEDDPAILRMTSKLLMRAGYRVLAANSPLEAITIAETAAAKIDLLLTDVVMPGMNGRELYEKIVSVYPGLRCLYMSGYTANVIAQQGILKEGIDFIAKPFTNLDLLNAIGQILNRSSQPDVG